MRTCATRTCARGFGRRRWQPSGDWEAMADLCGPEGVMPVGLFQAENARYIGKTLADIAEERGQHWVDAAFDLFLSEEQRISTIYFMMDEANVRRELQLPWNKISTDAGGYDPAWARAFGPTHPRSYGTYTRVLGKYVREEGVIPLEQAVRMMSSAVAEPLGAARSRLAARGDAGGRGRLRPGDGGRPRHVRRPAPAIGGGARRVGERRACAGRGRAYGRVARPARERPGAVRKGACAKLSCSNP